MSIRLSNSIEYQQTMTFEMPMLKKNLLVEVPIFNGK